MWLARFCPTKIPDLKPGVVFYLNWYQILLMLKLIYQFVVDCVKRQFSVFLHAHFGRDADTVSNDRFDA
jgi:hypothetical protein